MDFQIAFNLGRFLGGVGLIAFTYVLATSPKIPLEVWNTWQGNTLMFAVLAFIILSTQE